MTNEDAELRATIRAEVEADLLAEAEAAEVAAKEQTAREALRAEVEYDVRLEFDTERRESERAERREQAEAFVRSRVFVQRLEINEAAAEAAGVEARLWFEVIDRFLPPEVPKIVGEFDTEPEAREQSEAIVRQRLREVLR